MVSDRSIETSRTGRTSMRPRARLTGVVYLLYFLTAVGAELFTAHHLLALGRVTGLISTMLYVTVTLFLYVLFLPVNRSISGIAALLSLAGCIIMTLGTFHLRAGLSPFWLFGPYCVLIGFLIFRSTFLPRVLGVVMAIAGVGWLLFLSPSLPPYLSFAIKVLGIGAEGFLMVWLLTMGVDVAKWKAKARQSAGAV